MENLAISLCQVQIQLLLEAWIPRWYSRCHHGHHDEFPLISHLDEALPSMAKKIGYWLLIALVLSLGFGQLLRFDLFGLPLYVHDILVLCILALQGLTCDWRSVLKRNAWLQAKQGSSADERTDLMGTTGIPIFLLALGFSSIRAFTLYPIVSLLTPSLYALRLLAYLSLYLLLKQSKIHIPAKVFVIAGLVSLLIGAMQYFLMPDMRIFQYLGWDDHLSRLALPHFDPTFSAVMLSLAALSFPRFLPIFLIGILLTYSRSVWLSLIITATSFIRPVKYLLVIPVFIIFILLLPKKFGEGTNLLRTFSISSRLESDISYITKYKWDLIIGRGFNTLILDVPDSTYDNHATGPNNSYLYLLTTTGILGLVGWGIFMKKLYMQSIHKPMLMFFFIASLFNNVMFYPFALIWIFLIESDIVA